MKTGLQIADGLPTANQEGPSLESGLERGIQGGYSSSSPERVAKLGTLIRGQFRRHVPINHCTVKDDGCTDSQH